MMYDEFTKRTGIQPTMDEYYDVIEPLYTDYDGDKDKFCKEWKKMPQEMRDAVNKVVEARLKTIHEYADCIDRQTKQLNNISQDYNTLLDNIGKKESKSQELHNNEMLRLALESFSLVTAEADAVMEQAAKDIIGMVVDEAKDNIDKEMEEKRETAKEKAAKEEELEVKIEKARDERKDKEKITEDILEATTEMAKNTTELGAAQQEIQSVKSVF